MSVTSPPTPGRSVSDSKWEYPGQWLRLTVLGSVSAQGKERRKLNAGLQTFKCNRRGSQIVVDWMVFRQISIGVKILQPSNWKRPQRLFNPMSAPTQEAVYYIWRREQSSSLRVNTSFDGEPISLPACPFYCWTALIVRKCFSKLNHQPSSSHTMVLALFSRTIKSIPGNDEIFTERD